ncbi:glycerophosphodiester phosphodiesterase family protein [Paraferrimonas haliotis]|uniref:GP-PDE domain-containing protein n=1 Tax=Paraferrimonas haliotis TaxID=2013866 RepID=A0AA37WW71_9GAMM|nr:glycerophosphodiester phosphodiesterase family protein [Paraferrimonas haliotis]GLS83042.1 hypothetical protein GCM10007894_10190 [Paraferrimonas haliotis]
MQALRDILGAIAQVRRSAVALLRFQLVFKALLLVVLIPLAASLGGIGLSLVNANDLANLKLVSFLISPVGFISIFLLISAFLLYYYLEQAGMLFLLATDKGNQWQHSFRLMTRHAYPILRISALQSGAAMMLLIPLILIGLGLYHWLLSEYDINYYLNELPAEFIVAVSLLGLAGAAAIVALGIWMLNWQLALPLMLFEKMPVKQALLESKLRLHGDRHKFFIYLLIWFGLRLAFAIPLLAALSWSIDALVPMLPQDFDSALPWLVGILLFTTLSLIFISGIDSLLFAMVTTRIYLRTPNTSLQLNCDTPKQLPLWFKTAFISILLLLIADNYYLASDFFPKQKVQITAHRAGGFAEIENTLTGLRSAIKQGADLAEIDVQLSGDGQLIVMHDRDLMRLAGNDVSIFDDASSLLQVPLTPSAQQQPATLSRLNDFLMEAKDKIRLNIELKFYGQLPPQLVPKTLALIDQYQMADQVVLSSLSIAALNQAAQLNAPMPLGLIVSATLGGQDFSGYDFVAVNQGQLSSSDMVHYRQHKLQVHAWTVNTQVAAERAMLLGADNLITDEVALIKPKVEAFNQLSQAEIILRRLHLLLR